VYHSCHLLFHVIGLFVHTYIYIRMQSTSENEEIETESSSEAAGLARGAARTVNSISKQVRRQVMGNIPHQGSPNIIVPKPKVKVRIPKRIKPMKKVATVSDKLSTGLDVYDTYDYAASTVKDSEAKEKTSSWRTRFKTVVAFSGSK
jgi:hypothetical protein